MIKDTRGTRRAVGASAGAVLAMALAVVTGAVPVHGQPTIVSSAAASPLEDVVKEEAAEMHETAPEGLVEPGTEEPAPEASEPQVIAVAPGDAQPVASQSHAQATAPGNPAAPAPPPGAPPAATPSTPPPAPVAPASVPRRQPSPAEVQQALDGLAPYIDSIFTPTAAHVADAGDKVCTAFDEGQTFTQVKATARELVAKLPMTTVRPGADDYVVRTVVALYCPGHANKLV